MANFYPAWKDQTAVRTVTMLFCQRHLRLRDAVYFGVEPPAIPLERPVLEVLTPEASDDLPAGFYHLTESLSDPACLPVYAVSRPNSNAA